MLNNIKKHIKFFINYRHTIKENRIYLKNGEYTLDSTFKQLYLNGYSESINKRTFSNTQMKKINNFSLINIFFPIVVKNDVEIFKGEAMFISSSNEEVKIFNFKEKLVLTRFKSYEKFSTVINNRRYMSNIFSTPPINKIIYNKNILIENYLENEIVDKEYKINKIITSYNDFINEDQVINKIILNDNLNSYTFYKNLYKKIYDIDGKIPFIKCHGDLWDSNIIIHKNEFFLLDFEHVGYYSLFYDFLFYIFHEAYLFNDFSLLTKYFNGIYDYYLELICEKINFHSIDKEKYFLFFVYEFSSNRFSSIKCSYLYKEIDKLQKIIDYFNIEVERYE